MTSPMEIKCDNLQPEGWFKQSLQLPCFGLGNDYTNVEFGIW